MAQYTTGFNCVMCGHPVSNKAVSCPFCGDPDAGVKAEHAKREQDKREERERQEIKRRQREREERERQEIKRRQREMVRLERQRIEQERSEERYKKEIEKKRAEWIKEHPECLMCEGKGFHEYEECILRDEERGEEIVFHRPAHIIGCPDCGGKGYKIGSRWFGENHGFKKGDGKRKKNSPTPEDWEL